MKSCKGIFSNAASWRNGNRPSDFSLSVTRSKLNWPNKNQSTRWPWCFVPIWAVLQPGPKPVIRQERSITRYGVVRPWGPLTTGSKGLFLKRATNRKTVTVAMNLLFGAAVATRVNWLRHQGIALPQDAVKYQALELSKILELLDEQR